MHAEDTRLATRRQAPGQHAPEAWSVLYRVAGQHHWSFARAFANEKVALKYAATERSRLSVHGRDVYAKVVPGVVIDHRAIKRALSDDD